MFPSDNFSNVLNTISTFEFKIKKLPLINGFQSGKFTIHFHHICITVSPDNELDLNTAKHLFILSIDLVNDSNEN